MRFNEVTFLIAHRAAGQTSKADWLKGTSYFDSANLGRLFSLSREVIAGSSKQVNHKVNDMKKNQTNCSRK